MYGSDVLDPGATTTRQPEPDEQLSRPCGETASVPVAQLVIEHSLAQLHDETPTSKKSPKSNSACALPDVHTLKRASEEALSRDSRKGRLCIGSNRTEVPLLCCR